MGVQVGSDVLTGGPEENRIYLVCDRQHVRTITLCGNENIDEAILKPQTVGNDQVCSLDARDFARRSGIFVGITADRDQHRHRGIVTNDRTDDIT
jgi:hypothetical protein